VLPLLLAAALAHLPEIALYEDDTFIPAHTGHLVERLLRTPERFAVQRTVVDPGRAAFLNALLRSAADQPERVTAAQVVRELARFVRSLPDFAKLTMRLSSQARAVRDALLRATEPGTLVFKDLPAAAGCDPISSVGTSARQIRKVALAIKSALREISMAFPSLLREIEEAIHNAFGSQGPDSATAREELMERAAKLRSLPLEDQLGALCVRLSDPLQGDEWVRSLATLLASKPPETWSDRDLERLKLRLEVLAARFGELERLLRSRNSTPTEWPGARVAVVSEGRPGAFAFALPNAMQGDVSNDLAAQIRDAVRPILNGVGAGVRVSALAAALLDLLPASDERTREASDG
jgi:hypothetical protein